MSLLMDFLKASLITFLGSKLYFYSKHFGIRTPLKSTNLLHLKVTLTLIDINWGFFVKLGHPLMRKCDFCHTGISPIFLTLGITKGELLICSISFIGAIPSN